MLVDGDGADESADADATQAASASAETRANPSLNLITDRHVDDLVDGLTRTRRVIREQAQVAQATIVAQNNATAAAEKLTASVDRLSALLEEIITSGEADEGEGDSDEVAAGLRKNTPAAIPILIGRKRRAKSTSHGG